MIDPCVLTEPCWLEEYLDEQGVADQDWTREIPTPVIAVVEAMYERLDRDWCPVEDALALIARHFAAAAAHHAEAVARNGEAGPFPVYPLGGRWQATPNAIAQVLEARGRRLNRQVTRPLQLAKQREPEDQPVLFDLTEAS